MDQKYYRSQGLAERVIRRAGPALAVRHAKAKACIINSLRLLGAMDGQIQPSVVARYGLPSS